MGANREQRVMVVVYSLVFCLNLLGELGQIFNQPVEYSEVRAEILRGIFERLVGTLAKVD
jgi:hypothetical protein